MSFMPFSLYVAGLKEDKRLFISQLQVKIVTEVAKPCKNKTAPAFLDRHVKRWF